MGPIGRGERGTITAVSASTVTIKTSTATTTYAVTATSVIIDNGKSTLSALKTGDTVLFSTVTTAKTPTISQLFTGTMHHNAGGPGGPGGPGGFGPRPSGFGSPSQATA